MLQHGRVGFAGLFGVAAEAPSRHERPLVIDLGNVGSAGVAALTLPGRLFDPRLPLRPEDQVGCDGKVGRSYQAPAGA